MIMTINEAKNKIEEIIKRVVGYEAYMGHNQVVWDYEITCILEDLIQPKTTSTDIEGYKSVKEVQKMLANTKNILTDSIGSRVIEIVKECSKDTEMFDHKVINSDTLLERLNDYFSSEGIPHLSNKSELKKEAVNEVLDYLTELEFMQPQEYKTDSWRNWKYIRNSIVDKFLSSNEKNSSKLGGKDNE